MVESHIRQIYFTEIGIFVRECSALAHQQETSASAFRANNKLSAIIRTEVQSRHTYQQGPYKQFVLLLVTILDASAELAFQIFKCCKCDEGEWISLFFSSRWREQNTSALNIIHQYISIWMNRGVKYTNSMTYYCYWYSSFRAFVYLLFISTPNGRYFFGIPSAEVFHVVSPCGRAGRDTVGTSYHVVWDRVTWGKTPIGAKRPSRFSRIWRNKLTFW